MLGLTVGGLTGCDNKTDAAAAAKQTATVAPVSVVKLVQRDIPLTCVWFGHLRGVEQANIRPEVSGRLLRRAYQDGSLCKEGDVLFEIDPSTYQAAVHQAQATLKAAKSAVLQARATDDRAGQDVERYSKLVQSGSVAEKVFTDAQQAKKSSEAALAAAEAQVELAQAALENAQINLDRCTIRAPFTGMASKATVSKGDYIAPGAATPLTSMSSVNPIRVDFAVPGKEMLNRIFGDDFNEKSDAEKVVPEFELILEDGSTFNQKGHVVSIDSEVNSATGTVNFIGEVPNPDFRLRSGSAVRVRATIGTEKGAFLVPARALFSAMNHRFIYVVGPDKEPHCIDVQVGQGVTLPMPDGKGGEAPMLMNIITGTVKPLPECLKTIGIDNPAEAEVVVGGTQMAALISKANMKMRAAGAKSGFGTVVTEPFVYEVPVTTTPSVTAKQK